MPKLYRINNWEKIYENNRTRSLKTMSWFPLPVKLNGDGFTLMMEEKDGAMIFGCFIIILEIASTCEPRGTLIRSNGEPHDTRSLVRLSRMNVRDCDRCLQYCSTTLKWLICEEIENPAPPRHEGAGISHDSALQYSTVHNTTEHNSTENGCNFSDKYNPANRIAKIFYECITETGSGMKQPDFNKWAVEIDKIHRIDKRPWEVISITMQNTLKDTFWSGVLRSPHKLREYISNGKFDKFIPKEYRNDEEYISELKKVIDKENG